MPVVPVSALRALDGDPRWAQSVRDLLDAVDAYVPLPERAMGEPFLMPIENVLTISGRGTVVTGAVERGVLAVGEAVEVVGLQDTVASTAIGMESFGKTLDAVQAGDNAAVLLRGVRRDEVRRGQVLVVPGSVTPHARFDGPAARADRGRGRPAHAVRLRLPAAVLLPDDRRRREPGPRRGDAGAPGRHRRLTVELGKPVAMEVGLGLRRP